MATRKQFLVGFLMILTVLLMLFFMTSDYKFSLSFRANSHPLKIKDEKLRGHPKFFGGEDVEVMVYEGKEGDVVPEGLIPKGNAPPKVIVINTGEENIMEEITDEMREAEGWMVGDNHPEFPKVEINHGMDVKPAEPTLGPTEAPVTTIKSTTTEMATTETTTTTTTPTPTTTTETTSTYSPNKDRKNDKDEKIEVKKRDVGNMVHVTTETDPQLITSSAVPSSSLSLTTPTTETQSASQQTDHDPLTKSPGKQLSESPESRDFPVSDTATADKSAASQTGSQAGEMVTDFMTMTGRGDDKQSITEAPKTETSGTRIQNVSHNANNTNHNSTAAVSKADTDSNYQINNHHNQDPIVIENNDLPEEFLSDDSSENSFV